MNYFKIFWISLRSSDALCRTFFIYFSSILFHCKSYIKSICTNFDFQLMPKVMVKGYTTLGSQGSFTVFNTPFVKFFCQKKSWTKSLIKSQSFIFIILLMSGIRCFSNFFLYVFEFVYFSLYLLSFKNGLCSTTWCYISWNDHFSGLFIYSVVKVILHRSSCH